MPLSFSRIAQISPENNPIIDFIPEVGRIVILLPHRHKKFVDTLYEEDTLRDIDVSTGRYVKVYLPDIEAMSNDYAQIIDSIIELKQLPDEIKRKICQLHILNSPSLITIITTRNKFFALEIEGNETEYINNVRKILSQMISMDNDENLEFYLSTLAAVQRCDRYVEEGQKNMSRPSIKLMTSLLSKLTPSLSKFLFFR